MERFVPQGVPAQFAEPSDDAKRCADAVTLASIAGATGRWLAIRLSDGGCDNTIYDSRDQAITHQLRPDYCTYVQVPPAPMNAHEAEALLDYFRQLRDKNVRDDGPILLPLMPGRPEDRVRQILALARR